jgi:septal ring factor EnvC (AmiA/AmiB activator)
MKSRTNGWYFLLMMVAGLISIALGVPSFAFIVLGIFVVLMLLNDLSEKEEKETSIENNLHYKYTKIQNKKIQKELKKIKSKINELEKELKLLPNIEEAEELKNLKKEVISNLENKMKLLVQNYIQEKFNNVVYVIIPGIKNESKLPEDIQELYKTIAMKYFKMNKVRFLDVSDFQKIIYGIGSLMNEYGIDKLTSKLKVLSKERIVYDHWDMDKFYEWKQI